MDVTEIKDYLRKHIVETYLPGEAPENLADDTPLRTSGILDSIKTLQLISHLEEKYGIQFEAHEAGNLTTFDTIAGIAGIVEQKR